MPGSGKSFYQRKIINQFKKKKILKNDFKILNKLEKLFFTLLFSIKYPLFFIKTLYLIYFKIRKKNEKNRYFYYFYNEIALRAYFEKINENKIVLNDEGFLYRSAAYFNQKYDLKNLTNYLNYLPKINIIIFLNSSKKTNIKRTLSRKNEFRYSSENINDYSRKEKLLKILAYEYKKNRKIILIVINNQNKNTKKNLKKIFKTIKTIIL